MWNFEINEDIVVKWEKSIEDFVMADLRRAVGANNLQVGLIILSFVAVETLSGYFVGDMGDTEPFIKFIRESGYFPQKYRSQELAKDLHFHLRSKLVHDYVSKREDKPPKFELFREVDEPHLELTTNNLIGFSAKRFALDVLHAWEKFRQQTRVSENLYKNVISRINKLGYLAVQDQQYHLTGRDVLDALFEERELALAEQQRQQIEIASWIKTLNKRIEELQAANSSGEPIALTSTNRSFHATGTNTSSLPNTQSIAKPIGSSDTLPELSNQDDGPF